MNDCIVAHFRMKCKPNLVFILYGNDFIVDCRKNIDIRCTFFDIRCADEYHRVFAEAFKRRICYKASKLAAVGIPFYGYRQCAEISGIVIRYIF